MWSQCGQSSSTRSEQNVTFGSHQAKSESSRRVHESLDPLFPERGEVLRHLNSRGSAAKDSQTVRESHRIRLEMCLFGATSKVRSDSRSAPRVWTWHPCRDPEPSGSGDRPGVVRGLNRGRSDRSAPCRQALRSREAARMFGTASSCGQRGRRGTPTDPSGSGGGVKVVGRVAQGA